MFFLNIYRRSLQQCYGSVFVLNGNGFSLKSEYVSGFRLFLTLSIILNKLVYACLERTVPYWNLMPKGAALCETNSDFPKVVITDSEQCDTARSQTLRWVIRGWVRLIGSVPELAYAHLIYETFTYWMADWPEESGCQADQHLVAWLRGLLGSLALQLSGQQAGQVLQ